MSDKNELEIVVVGSNMIDLLSRISRLPQMGETLVGDSFQIGFGGKGANQAVMAARLGARVGMVTKVGDDIFGPMTRENLIQQGIDTKHVFSARNAASGVAPIFVDEQGRNMIVIIPGANMLLNKDDIHQAEEPIKNARVVIAQLEIPDSAIHEAFTIARKGKAITILNPAPARKVPAEIIENSDLIVPNETEAELLTGVPVRGLQGAEEAVKTLLAQGARNVVLTLGADGVLASTEQGLRHFPAYPVKAVDSTGAGDAFIGSLAFALVRGDNLPNAIQFANQCAALSVTKIGTQVSFPTLEEVEKRFA